MTTTKRTAKTTTNKATIKTTEAKETAATNTCRCGCGQEVANHYRPGHDARHVSQLVRDLFAGMATDETAPDDPEAYYAQVATHLAALPTEALRAKYVTATNNRAQKEYDRWHAQTQRGLTVTALFGWHPEDVLLATPDQYRQRAAN